MDTSVESVKTDKLWRRRRPQRKCRVAEKWAIVCTLNQMRRGWCKVRHKAPNVLRRKRSFSVRRT